MALQTKAERLATENGAMQTQLEMLTRHLEEVQHDNSSMKLLLLQVQGGGGGGGGRQGA